MSSCLDRGFSCFLQCFLGAGKDRKLSCCGYRVVRKGRMERNRLRPVYTCDFYCSNLMQISSPSGAISKGFYRDLTPQGFRTCYKLSEILLQFFNDASQGTPRDVEMNGVQSVAPALYRNCCSKLLCFSEVHPNRGLSRCKIALKSHPVYT